MAADGMMPYEGGSVLGTPASAEVERCLLAALLMRPSNFEVLPPTFGPHHFAYEDHGQIFEVARSAAQNGATYIMPVLKKDLGHLCGKDGAVSEIVAALMSTAPADAKLYADTLVQIEDRRRVLMIAEAMKAAALRPQHSGEPTSAIVAKAMERLDSITSGLKWSRGAISLDKAMANAIRQGEEIHRRGDGLAGITTGLRCLNQRMKGFLKGTMHIIGARPGMGKSALAVKMAIAAAKAGQVVLYISLEMEAEQLAQRALAELADVPVEDIMIGAFAQEGSAKASAQAVRLLRATEEMEGIPLDIEDEPALTAAAIKMRIRAAERRHGRVDMVIVDHMHIMGHSDTGRRHGAVQANTENSAALLAASKEFNVAMVVLAQLSRALEEREDKRPILKDLRESGAIEQDAFSVTFIYRDEYYLREMAKGEKPNGYSHDKWRQAQERAAEQAEAAKGKAELIVAKLRMGKSGTEHLLFDGPRTRFYEEGDRA